MVANTISIKRASPRDLITIPVFVGPTMGSKPKTTLTQLTAILDTGNDHTAINRTLLEEFGVAIDGDPIKLNGVTGSQMAGSCLVDMVIHLDNGEQCRIHKHIVVAADLNCEALLGRDILQWFDVQMLRNGDVTLTA